jgi:hypothetical protein
MTGVKMLLSNPIQLLMASLTPATLVAPLLPPSTTVILLSFEAVAEVNVVVGSYRSVILFEA